MAGVFNNFHEISTKTVQFQSALEKYCGKDFYLHLYNTKVINLKDIQSTDKELLGRGYYGCVETAKLNSDGTTIALKTFNSAISNPNHKYVELVLTSKCNHENIVKILGAGPSPKDYWIDYIVYEYASCKSLRTSILDRTDIIYDFHHICNWMTQISRAIMYLHSFNPKIVHRDLKPDNLLLFNGASLIKLCDFGISKIQDDKIKNSNEIGTGNYMPIEFLKSTEEDTTYLYTFDVYGFAIVFYELCTRKTPYQNMDFLTLITKKDEGLPKIEGLPPIIWDMINAAQSTDPKLRPKMSKINSFMEIIMNKIWSHLEPSEFSIEFYDVVENKKEYDRIWERNNEEEFKSALVIINDEIPIVTPCFSIPSSVKLFEDDSNLRNECARNLIEYNQNWQMEKNLKEEFLSQFEGVVLNEKSELLEQYLYKNEIQILMNQILIFSLLQNFLNDEKLYYLEERSILEIEKLPNRSKYVVETNRDYFIE